MPYSSNILERLKDQLAHWHYHRYLDVGCGAGKYGRMIRGLFPDSQISGIEIDAEYIDAFHLNDTYDDVINASIESILSGPQAFTYDERHVPSGSANATGSLVSL